MSQWSVPLPPDTYRVSQLGEEIQVVLQQAYSSLWVAGEIQRLKRHRSGHMYFEMVEKGSGDQVVGTLGAVIWRSDLLRISRALEDELGVLAEGREVRCRGNLDFYPVAGKLQFMVREIDPVFTVGQLALRRRQLLADLAARNLSDRNAGLPLVAPPLRIGLVASPGSAAYHDFESSLRASNYPFRLLVATAAVQGERAERELSAAIDRLGGQDLDCLVVIRGGGSRSDLLAFDSRRVAESICRCPLPVLTGLGHEIDQSVADVVAHTAFKTPTMVGEFLVGEVATVERRLNESQATLRRLARAPLVTAHQEVSHLTHRLCSSQRRIEALAKRLESLHGRTVSAGRLGVAVAQQHRRRIASRLVAAGPVRLHGSRHAAQLASHRVLGSVRSLTREAQLRLAGLARLVRELGPRRVLQRGFSITRTDGGVLVRQAGDVAVGARLTTELAAGRLHSRVVEASPVQASLDMEGES